MKIIVAYTSPDWDAIGSVWLIKKYLAGWGRMRLLNLFRQESEYHFN